MKFAAILAIFALGATLPAANATESTGDEADALTYCNEQAELAGIQDADEKNQYIQECLDTSSTPSGDSQN